MPLSKEFYLDEIKSKYPNSYNESLKDLPIKDLEDMLDFLESALEKADGGSIGIEVLFGPKREDFSIGGRAKPTQTYDPRASAVDYATALEKVGGGTAAQKRQDLSNYLGNLISTQGQKLGNAGVMALQGAKGVLGIQGTPITDSMQTSLQNIIQKQIQNTGKLSGDINYLDYGVLTDRKGQEFLGFGDRSFTDPEAALATTLGKASYAVDPRTGKVTFTGGTAYDFGDDQFGGLGKFISKGGVFSDKATQYNPDIGLSSDFMKQYNPSNISQSGVLPGFTKLRNPNSSPGNYNEFIYKGPDGQIYGSQTYASMAASGSYKDIYKDYYSKQKLADGGRVGLFMGGPPLEGQALSIYNSMSAYGFSDQEIANALAERGLYTPGGTTEETGIIASAPNIINQGGEGDGPPPGPTFSRNDLLGRSDYQGTGPGIVSGFKDAIGDLVGLYQKFSPIGIISNFMKQRSDKQKEIQNNAIEKARLEREMKEKIRLEQERAAQYGATNYGKGADGQQSYSGDAIGASGLGFGVGATTGGPVSNRTGRGRTDYSKGGLATMFTRRR